MLKNIRCQDVDVAASLVLKQVKPLYLNVLQVGLEVCLVPLAGIFLYKVCQGGNGTVGQNPEKNV